MAGARALLILAGTSLALGAAPVGAIVPAASSSTAVITVKVGGDRLSGAITDTGPASAAVTGVAGAQLALFADAADVAPINAAWATCTSDADGDCSFVVPDTDIGGVNRDAQFVVKQIAAPAGWSANTTLRTESETVGFAVRPYRFQTGPELRAGSTYSSLDDFMYSPAEAANFDRVDASSGVWQQSRVNPTVPQRCGLDLALIIDTSSSVGSELPELVAAADSLVDALTGTPSRIATFSFAASSPGALAGPNHPELRSVSTPEGAAAVKAGYAAAGISGGTNWDTGFFTAAAAPHDYDVAVVITDGNPTYYGKPWPTVRSVDSTRFKELEYGIFAANAVKAEGTRVLALGVGNGLNLPAISGPTAYDGSNAAQADYFTLSDFASAGEALRDVASRLCAGSVSVVTQVVPSANDVGDYSGATPVGSGWELQGSTTTPGVGGLPASVSTTDDGTGAVTFPMTFPVGVQSAALTLTPLLPSDHHLVGQDGAYATCTDLQDGSVVTVVNDDTDPDRPAFVLEAPAAAGLTCTVYVRPSLLDPGWSMNVLQAPALGMDVRVSQVQDHNGNASADTGDAISYEFGVTNLGSEALRDVAITSPLVGAVICPQTALAPAASMTCTAHAPFVVTDAVVREGRVESAARVAGLKPNGIPAVAVADASVALGDLLGRDRLDSAAEEVRPGGDLVAMRRQASSSIVGVADASEATTVRVGDARIGLPDTGGPPLVVGILGLGLILAGAAVLVRTTFGVKADST